MLVWLPCVTFALLSRRCFITYDAFNKSGLEVEHFDIKVNFVAVLVCDYIPNKKYRSENFSFYVTVFRII
jgi:hypothetical protein